MESAPWHGSDEPDFMPRVRRTFADQLPSRMEAIDDAVRRLNAPGEGGAGDAADRLFSAVHNLSGTGETVGAPQIGQIAGRMANIARPWVRGGAAPDAAGVADLGREAVLLQKAATDFLEWMVGEP